ncbi:hypothetical protein [Sulfurimonas sp.]|jgi:hypothetical protein|uniref:hypothetical protein n=1 Tax=Sulfurimonas sp. TaxID=2022749 RepID=UPI0025E001BE|nr:hypothetical protein [Sulfurimonas sp.]MBT5935131.1 hypothetical protein [Sulfurimonas sp.]
MKLNVLLSIFFIIVTTLSAAHEVEHIMLDDDSSCLVCNVNNNLISADVIDISQLVEIIHFEKISQNNFISTLHIKDRNNQNRAPPSVS